MGKICTKIMEKISTNNMEKISTKNMEKIFTKNMDKISKKKIMKKNIQLVPIKCRKKALKKKNILTSCSYYEHIKKNHEQKKASGKNERKREKYY